MAAKGEEWAPPVRCSGPLSPTATTDPRSMETFTLLLLECVSCRKTLKFTDAEYGSCKHGQSSDETKRHSLP